MRHIRTIIKDTPSPTNRLVYGIVLVNDWVGTLEEHPAIVNYPDKYEITEEDVPTDLTLWSIEYHNFEI
jgi:hypothetical protein